MRFVAVSDTHNRAENVAIPEGDVLLHAGDLTMRGTPPELERAARWLGSLRGRFHAIVVIPGNHDFGAERGPAATRAVFELHGVTWLVDEATEIGGLRLYGSPWQPWFLDWAFNFPRHDDGAVARATWSRIPADVELLMTHGPPAGILDHTEPRGVHAGCPFLRDAIRARPSIRTHVFGHIHEGYGRQQIGPTLFVNASTCDVQYRPVHPPIVFEA